jgi:PAS domain S-box-containing protein
MSELVLSDLERELLAVSPDAVIVVDEAGSIIFANPAVGSLFAYEPDELLGQPVELLVPERLRRVHTTHRKRFAREPTHRSMGAGLNLVGRRKNGTELPIDVGLAPMQRPAGLVVAAFLRDATLWTRSQQRLQATNELTSAVLAGADDDEVVQVVVRHARTLLGADTTGMVACGSSGSWASIRVVDPGELEAEDDIERAVHLALADRRVDVHNPPVVFDDLASIPSPSLGGALEERTDQLPGSAALGPVLAVPAGEIPGELRMLVVGRRRGREPFTPDEVQTAAEFATSAALAFRLGLARQEVEQLRMVAEYGRIGRDLHDTVIQRLFATGMSLQSVLLLLQGPVHDRVAEAVGELDATISEIRTTIFGLQHASAESGSVRSQVLRTTAESVTTLGFRPRVAFDGAVDTLEDEGLAREVVTVLGEALSNVARHAKASSVDVVLRVSSDGLVLSVSDDGVGPSPAPSAGNGLRNLVQRAEALGGTSALTRRVPSGSCLEWRVPLP